MTANICPKCRNAVMPYKRFLREAEPFRISACGNCGAQLRRSPKVYLLLLVMLIVLSLIGLSVFLTIAKAEIPFWIVLAIAVVILAAWTLLTKYLSWRTIGWILVTDEKKK